MSKQDEMSEAGRVDALREIDDAIAGLSMFSLSTRGLVAVRELLCSQIEAACKHGARRGAVDAMRELYVGARFRFGETPSGWLEVPEDAVCALQPFIAASADAPQGGDA